MINIIYIIGFLVVFLIGWLLYWYIDENKQIKKCYICGEYMKGVGFRQYCDKCRDAMG